MVKKPASGPASFAPTDQISESIDKLIAEIRLLRKIIDQIREDLSWVTRNGFPVQPIEHVVVKQMALDPCAKDWGDRLVIERYPSPSISPLDSRVLDYIAADLKATFEAIAQGQLDIVLGSIESFHRQLLSVLKPPVRPSSPSVSDTPAAETPVAIASPASREKAPKGHLF